MADFGRFGSVSFTGFALQLQAASEGVRVSIYAAYPSDHARSNNALPCALGPTRRYLATKPSRLVDRGPRVSLAFWLSAWSEGGPVTSLAPVAWPDCGPCNGLYERNECARSPVAIF